MAGVTPSEKRNVVEEVELVIARYLEYFRHIYPVLAPILEVIRQLQPRYLPPPRRPCTRPSTVTGRIENDPKNSIGYDVDTNPRAFEDPTRFPWTFRSLGSPYEAGHGV